MLGVPSFPWEKVNYSCACSTTNKITKAKGGNKKAYYGHLRLSYSPDMGNNNNTAAAIFAVSAILLLLLLSFSSPSVIMAQQTAATTTATISPPLTVEEQAQQTRLQNTIAAITRNLAQGHKQVDGIIYTPRWSSPIWVKPDSLSILFVYCLPGEFADSGQEIFGGSEMYVRQSFSFAVTNDITGWLMVVKNDNQTNRQPAAVGVICASDANQQVQTRVLSPQQQTIINNINQQFITIQNTQITNINQVINVINNVTVIANQTGGGMPPPSSNQTGGNNTGGLSKHELIVQIIPNATRGFVGASFQLKADVINGTRPYSYDWGPVQEPLYTCHDQFGTPDFSCVVYIPNQAGTHKISLNVTDSQGKTGSDSILVSVRRLPLGGGEGVIGPEPGGVATAPRITNQTGGEEGGAPPTGGTGTLPEGSGILPPTGGTAGEEGEGTAGTTTEGQESEAAPSTNSTGG
jgi:hypothetical protein